MILGLESSCDESALSLLEEDGTIIGEWVHSQVAQHAEYGGVVPDLAVGEHLRNFYPLLKLADPNGTLSECVSRISVTCGPGLVGCLGMGISIAKSLGLLWGKPVFGVNHLRGHAFSAFMPLGIPTDREWSELLPHLGLLVSGGNTLLFELDAKRKFRILARTVDDAVGEALDKGAKLLGIAYPGGAELERRAMGGNPNAYPFPRAFPEKKTMKFSFSGLKTSLLYTLRKMNDAQVEMSFADLCASYQSAAIHQILRKTQQASESKRFKSIGLSGGVANNQSLRHSIENLCSRNGIRFLPAEMRHTGDNASMIAYACLIDPQGLWPNLDQVLSFRPSLGLEESPAKSS